MRERLVAILFSLFIPLSPIIVVSLLPPPGGGFFIAGFIAGAALCPLIVIGTIHAGATLFSVSPLKGIWGVVLYLFAVVLLSVIAAIWSFYSA
jgi:hypothetical protein